MKKTKMTPQKKDVRTLKMMMKRTLMDPSLKQRKALGKKKRDKDKYARPKKRCQRSKDDEENTVGSSTEATKGPGKRKKVTTMSPLK